MVVIESCFAEKTQYTLHYKNQGTDKPNMNCLIVYATNSGATEEASEIVRDELVKNGWTVRMQRASASTPDDLGKADLTLLASGTWEHVTDDGKHIESVLENEWYELRDKARQHKASGKHFSVLGVGDHRYTHFAAAADHLESLIKAMGGILVGEALRLDGYFFHLPKIRDDVRAWAETLAHHPKLRQDHNR